MKHPLEKDEDMALQDNITMTEGLVRPHIASCDSRKNETGPSLTLKAEYGTENSVCLEYRDGTDHTVRAVVYMGGPAPCRNKIDNWRV